MIALVKSLLTKRTSVMQDKLPNRAVVAESVVALVTRKGNPKNIKGWDDLIRSAA